MQRKQGPSNDLHPELSYHTDTYSLRSIFIVLPSPVFFHIVSTVTQHSWLLMGMLTNSVAYVTWRFNAALTRDFLWGKLSHLFVYTRHNKTLMFHRVLHLLSIPFITASSCMSSQFQWSATIPTSNGKLHFSWITGGLINYYLPHARYPSIDISP